MSIAISRQALLSRAVSYPDWIRHMTMTLGSPRRLWCAVASCALLLTLPISAAGRPLSKKLDSHLQQTLKRGAGPYRVIIRVRPGQRGAIAHALRKSGHAVYGDHAGIEGLSVEVSASTLQALANNPNVKSISTDADLDALDSKASDDSNSNKPTKSTTKSTTPTTSRSFYSAECRNRRAIPPRAAKP